MKTLYYNGRLYTGDRENPEASAMAVEDGRIIWVGELPAVGKGSQEDALGDWDEKRDLKGRFLTPGLIDSHMHVLEYGKFLQEVSLAECTGSLEEVCGRVKEFIEEEKVPEGAWVCGRGWNQDYFQDEKRFLNCHDLDAVSTKHPIFLARACGHVVAVNSKAMELAGVTGESPQPEDGHFRTDEKGEPLGIFEENAIDMVKRAMPADTLEKVKEYIAAAQKSLNGFGITSAHTDDFLALAGVGYETVLKAYRELEEEGRLTVKIYEQSQFEGTEELGEFIEKGYHTGVGSDYVKIGPLKLVGDGSLGARTAFLTAPYADSPDTCGIPVFTQEKLDEMISYANRHGMQIAVHAIGDAMMERVMRAFEKALRECPRTDHRHGIVHCQITTPALLKEFGRLSLHAYIQSIFLDYDSRIVRERVGEERAAHTYQFKTLRELGCGVSNGSDSPVETPNVAKGIQCAVTRSSLDGGRSFLPDQALTVEEALESYTSMGARASFEEHEKGMLKKGMAADFVVFRDDLRAMPPQSLGRAVVEETYVDGVCVYRREREEERNSDKRAGIWQ